MRNTNRLAPIVGDTVLFTAPDSTHIAARVTSIKNGRMRVTELARQDGSVFQPFSSIPTDRWTSFVPVAPTVKIANNMAENVAAGLTKDGYEKYVCDTCSRVSHRKPGKTQTTCRPCSKI